jgi:hypothetical protein
LAWLLCQDGETQDEELHELAEVARRKLLELGHPNCRCILAPSYFHGALVFADFINNELEFGDGEEKTED